MMEYPRDHEPDFRCRRQGIARPHRHADDEVQGRPRKGGRRHRKSNPRPPRRRGQILGLRQRRPRDGRGPDRRILGRQDGRRPGRDAVRIADGRQKRSVHRPGERTGSAGGAEHAGERGRSVDPEAHRRAGADGQGPNRRRGRADPREHAAGPVCPAGRDHRRIRPPRRDARRPDPGQGRRPTRPCFATSARTSPP